MIYWLIFVSCVITNILVLLKYGILSSTAAQQAISMDKVGVILRMTPTLHFNQGSFHCLTRPVILYIHQLGIASDHIELLIVLVCDSFLCLVKEASPGEYCLLAGSFMDVIVSNLPDLSREWLLQLFWCLIQSCHRWCLKK